MLAGSTTATLLLDIKSIAKILPIAIYNDALFGCVRFREWENNGKHLTASESLSISEDCHGYNPAAISNAVRPPGSVSLEKHA